MDKCQELSQLIHEGITGNYKVKTDSLRLSFFSPKSHLSRIYKHVTLNWSKIYSLSAFIVTVI